jgi:hypothetical protein
MGNDSPQTTEAANDLNPNGFVTDREVDGERRSIRHYNDGRISGRGRNVEASLRTKMRNSSETGCRVRPPTSRRESGGRSTPTGSGPAGVADITAAMAKLTVDHPNSAKVKKLSKKLNLDADPGIETVTLRKVTPSSVASVVSSKCSGSSSGSVNARIADIENRVRKHIKTRLQSITEEDEE